MQSERIDKHKHFGYASPNMASLTNWAAWGLIGIAFTSALALSSVRPKFVTAPSWLKGLFIVTWLLLAVSFVVVFAGGWDASRKPLAFITVGSFVASLAASRYLRRAG